MWKRPLSDCREEKKKAEKGYGDHISAIGYYTHILKKPWDFH
jgi:hypothetical protein